MIYVSVNLITSIITNNSVPMKLAIITAYPPNKVTLNEYVYHLVKHFRQKQLITELILLTDVSEESKTIDFVEKGCKITVKKCLKL